MKIANLNDDQKREVWKKTVKAEFFYQLVIDEIDRRQDTPLAILDIGCGGGFHHRADLQANIGARSSRFIGIEPDPEAKIISKFDKVHRGMFHQTPIESRSVDLAYAVMVLEHVEKPTEFFAELERVLAPGGVFLGFTVDARHWFSSASSFLEKSGLKEAYLRVLQGRRGIERYENFPTAYRCNKPRDLEREVPKGFKLETLSLHKVGQLDYYFPKLLHPMSHLMDKLTLACNLPGSCLVVRIERT
jgi:SAM-dependent methyltransferase